MNNLQSLAFRYPKIASLLAGMACAPAMAPYYLWPLLMIGLCAMTLIIAREEKPWNGAWCGFSFGMGYFVPGLWWVANAFGVDMAKFWWAVPFAVLGLPLLLSALWFVAGYMSVRLSRANTLARGVLFVTLLALAEYGRAFNFSGFPWNLFGYTWASTPAFTQLAALGGAYFVTGLTILWMAAPALIALARKKAAIAIAAITIVSFAAAFAYGAARLKDNPPETRNDNIAVIVQPNIPPEAKWEADRMLEHFADHVRLSREGLDKITPTSDLKTVTMVWPETALDAGMIMAVPDVPRVLLELMQAYPFNIALVTGLWREDAGYYNSIALITVKDGKLDLADVYDKHHLVPFGEYLPLEETLNLTPLVGFSGFKRGPGPAVLHADGVPGVSPLICFEAIFPWYGASGDAEWLVNTSNDGWYGDTPGPYQHLAMTQFRAIEQGKPIMRSATTGVSAVIDSYGRVLESLGYNQQGSLTAPFPKIINGGTTYTRLGETLFFLIVVIGFAVFGGLRSKNI